MRAPSTRSLRHARTRTWLIALVGLTNYYTTTSHHFPPLCIPRRIVVDLTQMQEWLYRPHRAGYEWADQVHLVVDRLSMAAGGGGGGLIDPPGNVFG